MRQRVASGREPHFNPQASRIVSPLNPIEAPVPTVIPSYTSIPS